LSSNFILFVLSQRSTDARTAWSADIVAA
jgi:hypothetical protein